MQSLQNQYHQSTLKPTMNPSWGKLGHERVETMSAVNEARRTVDIAELLTIPLSRFKVLNKYPKLLG